MEWLNLLIGFFVANVLGYGGGPSSIPLMYREIVTKHHWLDNEQFSSMLALGNALPGPIATKIAAYVGYDIAGWLGVLISLLATVVPSALALIVLMRTLQRYKQSTVVKGMTLLVQPVIAIMMLVLTWSNSIDSVHAIGIYQFLGIALVAWYLMARRKVHPALLIVCAFVYGGVVLS
ncbi:chromate transporter [Paenibacillus koleovorans]|uniref:chromate transporter n=1 Tax=Paenibacillus koleovorans TaxID=121608 RepID=UPI000FDAAE04|nr:chromate transporter [Paenibacillus koleovorans]